MNTIRINILFLDKPQVSFEVTRILAEQPTGFFEVLPNHQPIIAELASSVSERPKTELKAYLPTGEEKTFSFKKGYFLLEFNKAFLTILEYWLKLVVSY